MFRHSIRAFPRLLITNSLKRTFRSCLLRSSPQSVNYALTSSFSNAAIPTKDEGDKHEFQAETRQLLDIVTNSIYTDKDVFIRELISNASDALEKLRHLEAVGEPIISPDLKPEIHITTDEANNTLTIADTGLGMTKSELIENLGTIARSGSKAFMDQLKDKGPTEATSAATGIIGKFGVGFYSAFMVGETVEVFTKSANPDSKSHVWKSDGTGSYEISPVDEASRGSKIVIHLKETSKEYSNARRVESIIKQYSNFVSFPIVLNGEIVNTVQALWTKNSNEITEEEFTEFYKFVANAFDDPMYRLQYKADAPIELKTLFFIGSSHTEKYGYARLQPGVSLYSRKVLIERNSPDILPDWLRFIRGVVDSEDLPLSLSRERMQDSRILAKIRDVLTRRILKFLEQQSTQEPEKYEKFFNEFGNFIKEGICMDFQHKDALAKLVRYESSHNEQGQTTTLDEYVSRCSPDQSEIYFLCSPSRQLAEASPYYEAFKKTGKEVLFVYSPIDDFVMNNIQEFNGRKVISAENAKLDLDEHESEDKLTLDQASILTAWMKLKLEENVKDVKVTNRLVDSPAVITDHESASVRQMMAMVNSKDGTGFDSTSKHTLEVNSSHPIIIGLHKLRETNEQLAEKVLSQLYDNAALGAGLMQDGRSMIPRLNDLLIELLKKSKS